MSQKRATGALSEWRGAVSAALLGFFLVWGLAGSGSAQTPAFDLSAPKPIAGPRTQVLVLGSAHLAQMDAPLNEAALKPLLDRLAAFRPTIIAHEGLSGLQCDHVKRFPTTYKDVFSTYCIDLTPIEAETKLSVPAAQAKLDRLLPGLPARLTPVLRRRLVMFYSAAGDQASARVQWLQLPMRERKLADGVTRSMKMALDKHPAAANAQKPGTRRFNEREDVAVALAARLGLRAVVAMDDHTADAMEGGAGPGFEAALQKIWAQASPDFAAAYKVRADAAGTPDGMMDLYRYMNRPDVLRGFADNDFLLALKQQTPELYGRRYVAWWETRNLRMAANIRAAFANAPGARVLVIVGASHKPYLDAYLAQMHEVDLVDAEAILGLSGAPPR